MPICHKYREPAAIYKVDRVTERGNQLEGAVLKIVTCPKRKLIVPTRRTENMFRAGCSDCLNLVC